jgi:hypothetical protein
MQPTIEPCELWLSLIAVEKSLTSGIYVYTMDVLVAHAFSLRELSH